MRGYQSDYSRSNRAARAEAEGMVPASRVTQAWCDDHGIYERASFVKWLIRLGVICPEEWHHTSKMYNRTDYYSAASIVEQLTDRDFGDEKQRGTLAFFRALYQSSARPKNRDEYNALLLKGELNV